MVVLLIFFSFSVEERMACIRMHACMHVCLLLEMTSGCEMLLLGHCWRLEWLMRTLVEMVFWELDQVFTHFSITSIESCYTI